MPSPFANEVWIPSYIAYGLVDTMAPLYGVMAPKGSLGEKDSRPVVALHFGWFSCLIPNWSLVPLNGPKYVEVSEGCLVLGGGIIHCFSTMLKMIGLAWLIVLGWIKTY